MRQFLPRLLQWTSATLIQRMVRGWLTRRRLFHRCRCVFLGAHRRCTSGLPVNDDGVCTACQDHGPNGIVCGCACNGCFPEGDFERDAERLRRKVPTARAVVPGPARGALRLLFFFMFFATGECGKNGDSSGAQHASIQYPTTTIWNGLPEDVVPFVESLMDTRLSVSSMRRVTWGFNKIYRRVLR